MLAAGSERHAVMDALVAEVAPLLDAAYEACVELVRASVVVEGPELEVALRERLALDEGDPVADSVVRDALERHLLDPGSEVAGVPSGAVVHVPTLLADCVLTHHLSDVEEAQGRLAMDPDLAAFGRIAEPRTAGGPLTVELDAGGDMTWTGPAGWLPRPAAGEVLTLRTEDGQIVPATAPGGLPAPPGLVTALRAVYDGQLADPPLPLAGDLLLLGLLAADRSAFACPSRRWRSWRNSPRPGWSSGGASSGTATRPGSPPSGSPVTTGSRAGSTTTRCSGPRRCWTW